MSHFFYQLSEQAPEAIAAIEGEERLSYQELALRCELMQQQIQQRLSQARQENVASTAKAKSTLIFVKAHNTIATLISYLAALQANLPLMLLDPDISDDKLSALIHAYQPSLLIDQQTISYLASQESNMAPQLALLLSTSGSTGSAKQVCLSGQNLQSNARSICDYLPILPSDVTITTLPFFYSYGLSVINSHLLAGACIVFNQHSVLSREFWQLFKQWQVCSFAGVPYSYEMLLRLRFERMALPSLRYFTQAGGKLAEDKIKSLARFAHAQQKQFFVMYGQTEATARMAYMPDERIEVKPYSIGQAIPGGEFELWDAHKQPIQQHEQAGELVYRGPNVMLGYAHCRDELSTFTAPDVLQTGDIAYRDKDGDFVICGRSKRMIKLFGERVNLDEVESLLNQHGVTCFCLGEDATLQVATVNYPDNKDLKKWLSSQLKVNHQAIEVVNVAHLPYTANGKKDYPALKAMLESHIE